MKYFSRKTLQIAMSVDSQIESSKSSVRLHKFTVVSGIGWIIDIGLMTALVWLGQATFVANLTSAFLGITFVFVLSQKHIFRSQKHFLYRGFIYYCLWHIVAVPLASMAIHVLATKFEHSGLQEIWATIELEPVLPWHVAVSIVAKGFVTLEAATTK